MKGFLTLATGNEHYYWLAKNLLTSYKLRGGNYPFAILCDRENQFTKCFDKVVLLKSVSNNYLDKFRILVEAPFDENIFIEPDCLIYQNIDCFWDYFGNATDCSSFGWNNSAISTFLNADDIQKAFNIKTAPLFCPGYIFVRKGKICENVYNDAIWIAQYLIKHKEKHSAAFVRDVLRDDPVFFCAMALNDCICSVKPKVAKCIQYPSFKQRNGHFPTMSFHSGFLEDDNPNECARLCHFSTKHTRLGKYHQQILAMNCYHNGFDCLGKLIETPMMESVLNLYYRVLNKFFSNVK